MPPRGLRKIYFGIYVEHIQWAGVNRVSKESKVSKAELVREGIDLMLKARGMHGYVRDKKKGDE